MARLRFLPAARRDLLDLYIHISTENTAAADRVIDRIEAACARLRDHPELGPIRPEIGVGARVLIIGRWLALYRLGPNDVQIVRVIDGARDLKRISWTPD